MSRTRLKWLSVRLRTKWFWVQVQLQSLHYESNSYIVTWQNVMWSSNLSFQFHTCLLYYSKTTWSVDYFKLVKTPPLFSSHHYLNRRLSCIPESKNESSELRALGIVEYALRCTCILTSESVLRMCSGIKNHRYVVWVWLSLP